MPERQGAVVLAARREGGGGGGHERQGEAGRGGQQAEHGYASGTHLALSAQAAYVALSQCLGHLLCHMA